MDGEQILFIIRNTISANLSTVQVTAALKVLYQIWWNLQTLIRFILMNSNFFVFCFCGKK